jgi:uncharacterized membrane protein
MKFFFFILCISLLVLILSKSDELSILKALACVNIITSRHQNEEKDPSTLSPKILTCFIKISDEQISKLLDNIEQGLDISLTEDEINNLMDIDSLKDLPQDEVKQKGEQFIEAIKEFQKTQGEYNSEDNNGYDEAYDDEDDDYDYEDYDGPKNNMTKKGFFRLIKKGFINLIEILFSSWYIICILVVFYLLLLEIRRNNHNKKEKEEDKKDNTIKEKKEENIKNDEDKIKEKKEEKNKNEKKSKEDSENIKEKMD